MMTKPPSSNHFASDRSTPAADGGQPAPTLRSLAKSLNLSPTTVSEALRGVPRVNAATRELVRAAASAARYQLNPLASAVMSDLRRSRRCVFRGTLAALISEEAAKSPFAREFFDGIIAGARARALELGFGLEPFVLGPSGIRGNRVDRILQSRGIRGVVVLPALHVPDFETLDWTRYAGVYTDYIKEGPALHAVCADHFRSLIGALERLSKLGYRRPGLFLPRRQDERLQHRWEGAFCAFQNRAPKQQPVPPLINDTISRAEFCAWFEQHRPDVVVGHDCAAIAWMKACGAVIPLECGFFCLNLATATEPCAGIDLQPRLIGQRAAEIVIGELHHNETGLPANPSLTTLLGRWVDGPTIGATKIASLKNYGALNHV